MIDAVTMSTVAQYYYWNKTVHNSMYQLELFYIQTKACDFTFKSLR